MIWELIYHLNSPIQELALKGYENIESFGIIKEESSGVVKLIGFTLFIETSNYDEAKKLSQIIANRVYDYLTSIHGVPIKGNLACYKKSSEKFYTVGRSIEFRWSQLTAEKLDLSLVEKLAIWDEIKLMRQLSHYRIGLKALDDIITQIREFYLIVEDEYGNKNHPKHAFLVAI